MVMALFAPDPSVRAGTSAPTSLHKVQDLVIYQDPRFYAAFPSVVRRPTGELLVAFRRAPNRLLMGAKANTHTDPNSYLVLVRSRDGGRSWSESPEPIFAHPLGGSQDPCLLQLRDGTLLCTSYGWALVNPDYARTLTNTLRHGSFAFLGGYVLRSTDGGRTWQGPFLPPHVSADATVDALGNPVPAYNRGALCEGRDGRLYWVVAANASVSPRRTETHLLISSDQGRTWQHAGPVARDEKVTFNETALYETPRGDLVAFMRTANFDDQTVVARSTDRGRSFQPWQSAGWRGHPHHAVRLPDKRVLLVYGYRHQPFGIRARVLNPECTDYQTAPEIVLRDDGGNTDLGYPWATMIARDRVLVVYYFNAGDGIRHIAGSVLAIR